VSVHERRKKVAGNSRRKVNQLVQYKLPDHVKVWRGEPAEGDVIGVVKPSLPPARGRGGKCGSGTRDKKNSSPKQRDEEWGKSQSEKDGVFPRAPKESN
jgi:hypothetical protein